MPVGVGYRPGLPHQHCPTKSQTPTRSVVISRLTEWMERREEAKHPDNTAGGSSSRFSHRLLDTSGIRLIPEETVKSILWCLRRRSSFVLTDRRLIYAQREGREATAHWAELSEVKNAGITRVSRSHPLLAIGAFCVAAGIILAFVVGFWGLAPGLMLGALAAGIWFLSEGNATIYANLGGQQMQGEVAKRDRRRASEFVNLLFELKQR